jgi:hypothetical protein
MNLVRNWIRSFPEPQKEAIAEAIESASLAKICRALRLLEKLGPDRPGSKSHAPSGYTAVLNSLVRMEFNQPSLNSILCRG